MKTNLISKERLAKALAIKDLSDPVNGVHAINLVVSKIFDYLAKKAGWPKPEIRRTSPISSVENDFDRLYFPPDNLTRLSRYTRYLDEKTILRTHTTAMIPDILIEIRKKGLMDYSVLCPGICYRRDVVDSRHTGEPHQMDIWRIKKGTPRLERKALIDLIESVLDVVIPGSKYRANEVSHPYTINGLEVEILVKGYWLELLECGEAHPKLLSDAGLDPEEYSGLAMGIGLDRSAMLLKSIDDIRILRSEDPRIKQQLTNLDLYRSVSKYPPVRQDLSVSVSQETNEEDVCEIIKDALGDNSNVIEEITIVSETNYDRLPAKAIERLGISPGQKNMLIRVVLRSHERSLTHKEANEMRDNIYRAVNQSGTEGYLANTE
jgi:phenylalanyl-tRNA synthetase alpha chain